MLALALLLVGCASSRQEGDDAAPPSDDVDVMCLLDPLRYPACAEQVGVARGADGAPVITARCHQHVCGGRGVCELDGRALTCACADGSRRVGCRADDPAP